MSLGGHRTLPNGYAGSLGLRWRLCVCLCVCVHIRAHNVHPHMDAHMHCVRSHERKCLLRMCLCVFVCDSECVYSQKMAPGSFFFSFFFFTFYFQTHKVMTISFLRIKRRSKPAGDSSILLTRLRSSTSQ